jgi:hypothetical protein
MARRYEVNAEIVAPELRPVAEPVNTFMTPGVRAPVINEFLDLAPLSKGLSDLAKAYTEVGVENAEKQAKAAYGSSDPEIKALIDKRKNGTLTESESAKLMKAKEIPQAFTGQFYKNIDILAARDHLRDYRNELATHVERIGRVVKDTGRIDGMSPEEAIQKIQTDLWNKYSSKDLFKSSYWAQSEAGQAKGAIDSEFSSAVTSVFTRELEAYEKASVGREVGDVLMSGYQNPEDFEKSVAALVERFRSMPLVDMQAKIGQGGLAFIQAQLANKKITEAQAQSMVATLMAVKINGNELSKSNPDFAVDAANLLERLEGKLDDAEERRLRNIGLTQQYILDILLEPMDPNLPMSERLDAASKIIKNPSWEYANQPSVVRSAEIQIAAARNPPQVDDEQTKLDLELASETTSGEDYRAQVTQAMQDRKISVEYGRNLIARHQERAVARGAVASDPKLRASKVEWAAEAGSWENKYGKETARFLVNASGEAEAWLENQLLTLEADTKLTKEDKATQRAEIEKEGTTRRTKAIEGALKETDDLRKMFKEYSLGGVKPPDWAWQRAPSLLGPAILTVAENDRANYTHYKMFDDRPNRLMNKASRFIRSNPQVGPMVEGWIEVADSEARMVAQETYRKMAKEGRVDDPTVVMNAMEAAYNRSLKEQLRADTGLDDVTKKATLNALFHDDPYGYTMDSTEIQSMLPELTKIRGIKSSTDNYDGEDLADISPILYSNGTRNSNHIPKSVWADEDTSDLLYEKFLRDSQDTNKLLPASDPRIGQNGAIDARKRVLETLSGEIAVAKDKRGVVLEVTKLYGMTEQELMSGMLNNAPGLDGIRIKGKPRMFDMRDINPMTTPLFVDMSVADFSAMMTNANDPATGDYTKLRELGIKLGISDPEQVDENGELIDSNIANWESWLVALTENYNRMSFTRYEQQLSTVDATADAAAVAEEARKNEEALAAARASQQQVDVQVEQQPVDTAAVAAAEEAIRLAQEQQQQELKAASALETDYRMVEHWNTNKRRGIESSVAKLRDVGWLTSVLGGKSNKQYLVNWTNLGSYVDAYNNELSVKTADLIKKGIPQERIDTLGSAFNIKDIAYDVVWNSPRSADYATSESEKLLYGRPNILKDFMDKEINISYEWTGPANTPKLKVDSRLPNWDDYPEQFVLDLIDANSKNNLPSIPEYESEFGVSQYQREKRLYFDKPVQLPKRIVDSALLWWAGVPSDEIDFILTNE